MTVKKLPCSWTLWFHSPAETSWDISSYQKVATIDTIEDFWNVYSRMTNSIVEDGMFFFFCTGISPIWEDSKNKNGGCWSFKIYKKYIPNTWLDLSVHTIAETITKSKSESKTITGVSISPKKSFSIIKIWNNNSNKKENKLLTEKIEHLRLNECLYKAHKGR